MENKICINCYYCNRTRFSDEWICFHPSLPPSVNLVNGVTLYNKCKDERTESGTCGISGKLYEPKC
jgi:hypothetical protein